MASRGRGLQVSMDPSESDWLGSCKSEAVRELHNNGNAAQSWQWRELGLNPSRGANNRTVLEHAAEERLIHKSPLNLKCCDLPGYPRSTFLMVFSPDGTTVASTHGNHNIYLTELASGKHVRILRGHPRTPWCIAFHPSHAELVGSGCLGGQVRVWDLSGGSEVWTVSNETVIASIAFHPRDQLLVVATYNELYFWDWNQPAPFTKVCTNNVNEKVRYVAFDALGHKLVTGISVWSSGSGGNSLLQPTSQGAPGSNNPTPPDPPPDPQGARQAESSAQELIVTSYHNLVQRYDSLVRNYHRLFLARSQATNTTDRGTDPMEMDWSNISAASRQAMRAARSSLNNGDSEVSEPVPGTLNVATSNAESNDRDTAPPARSQERSSQAETTGSSRASRDGHSIFGSRPSAFQPLNDSMGDRSLPYNASAHQRQLLFDPLPNPFSSSPSLSQTDLRHRLRNSSVSRTRAFTRDPQDTDELTNAFSEANLQHRRNSSSRTRVFTSPRNNESAGSNVMDASDLTRRTLYFDRLLQLRALPLREPDDLNVLVSEATRRRALERLLELEQISPNEAGAATAPIPPAQSEPSPPTPSSLEQMFRSINSPEPRRDVVITMPNRIPSPEIFMPSTSTSDPVLRDLLSFETSGPDNPPFTSSQPVVLRFPGPPTISDPSRRSATPQTATSAQTGARTAATSPSTGDLAPSTSSAAPESGTGQNQPMTITQSLDIIRDILRDSGTRLLNLITDMSYSTLTGVDVASARQLLDPVPSEELFTVTSPRSEADMRRSANRLSSVSDTDSDHSLEVNIYRTRNATFPESRSADPGMTNNVENERIPRPTSRMVVNLDVGGPAAEQSSIRHTLNGINITVSNNRFQLRTNNVPGSDTQTSETQPEEDRREPATANAVSSHITPVASSAPNSTPYSDFSTAANSPASSGAFPVAGSSARFCSPNATDTSSAPPISSAAGPSSATSFSNSAEFSTVLGSLAEANISTPMGFSAAASASPSAGSSTAAGSTDRRQDDNVDWQMPSTSRDNDWLYSGLLPLGEQSTQNPLSAADALRKVKLGIEALQRHTSTLTDMWLRGTRTSMRELRMMWEDLRRQIVALHRQTGRSENSNYFTRSILERCHMLTDMSRRSLSRTLDNITGREQATRNTTGTTTETAVQANVGVATESAEPSRSDNAVPSTSSASADGELPSVSRNLMDTSPAAHARNIPAWARNKRSAPTAARSAFKARCTPPTRRRLQTTSYRYRTVGVEDFRRRQRIVQRIEQYLQNARTPGSTRTRRENARSIELQFTRHEIRVRAMQVLSIMFNVMMACLEEGELSSHIIVMLRTLKKSLGVTCLLLMTNNNRRRELVTPQNFRRRNSSGSTVDNPQSRETSEAPASLSSQLNSEAPSAREESQQFLTTNPGVIHVHTPLDNSTSAGTQEARPRADSSEPLQVDTSSDMALRDLFVRAVEKENKSTSTSSQAAECRECRTAGRGPDANDGQQPSTSHRWSDRLAIQISAANKNQSETARRRRDIYLERKRLKALHRHNPVAHPLTKRKIIPPLVAHRIPTPRAVPLRDRTSITRRLHIAPNPTAEPVAGPSNPQPGPSTSGADAASAAPRTRQEYRQEYRAGLFRFAQFHAARLRNATRNRYRIRLYTPSSVREMFDILTTSTNEREPESPPTLNNAQEPPYRRPFSTYRPRLLTVRNNFESATQGPEGSRPFGSLLNNVSVPLVQVNSLPVNEAPGPAPPNPPRVNEYLQPIILAQNALVVEEAVGGGLLEAGLISESLIVPVHRVQAWDFTKGESPDIKDSTKNMVVKRCKIHNDASIDISRDGRLLVALLPVHRMRNMSHRLGVYSLEWERLGECLHTVVLEQSAVSVALSPTARHLAVGLGSRRVTTLPHNRNNVFALLFRLADEGPVNQSSRQCGLIPVRILDHNWEHGFTSLNCLRWAPTPGQGLLYANNTGQLIIMS